MGLTQISEYGYSAQLKKLVHCYPTTPVILHATRSPWKRTAPWRGRSCRELPLFGELHVGLLSLAEINSLRRVEVDDVRGATVQTCDNARQVRSSVFDVAFNSGAVEGNRIGKVDVFSVDRNHGVFRDVT